MDPANPICNLDISESMVNIDISLSPKEMLRWAGIIVDCDEDSAYIIADARPSQDDILKDNTIKTTISSASGVELLHDEYHVENGLIGIMCFPKPNEARMNTLKKIKMCVRPLNMCEAVYVYEGITHRLTSGNVTKLSGPRFSHNCAVSNQAEFGAPVLNKDGEMVGISCSVQYHLSAIKISELIETIRSIWDTIKP